jgi:Family of unknown function (DUF6266)
MAKFINGINGPVQGKVGSVIGSSWKGVPYLKGPYKKRTAKVSKKETANRKKFAAAQFFLRPLLDFVRVGFKGYSPLSEGFVAAKSQLLLNAFEGIPPKQGINPALVKLSYGDLPLPNNIKVEKINKDELQFTWDTGDVDLSNAKDQVMLLAYDIANERADYTTTGQFRSNGSDILQINGTKKSTYHLYVAFNAADRSRQSESVYLGTIVL